MELTPKNTTLTHRQESDIRTLSDSMKSIDAMCTSVNGTMSVRRDKIDELSGVFRLLKVCACMSVHVRFPLFLV